MLCVSSEVFCDHQTGLQCGAAARCVYNHGLDASVCTCNYGYVGDGFDCQPLRVYSGDCVRHSDCPSAGQICVLSPLRPGSGSLVHFEYACIEDPSKGFWKPLFFRTFLLKKAAFFFQICVKATRTATLTHPASPIRPKTGASVAVTNSTKATDCHAQWGQVSFALTLGGVEGWPLLLIKHYDPPLILKTNLTPCQIAFDPPPFTRLSSKVFLAEGGHKNVC